MKLFKKITTITIIICFTFSNVGFAFAGSNTMRKESVTQGKVLQELIGEFPHGGSPKAQTGVGPAMDTGSSGGEALSEVKLINEIVEKARRAYRYKNNPAKAVRLLEKAIGKYEAYLGKFTPSGFDYYVEAEFNLNIAQLWLAAATITILSGKKVKKWNAEDFRLVQDVLNIEDTNAPSELRHLEGIPDILCQRIFQLDEKQLERMANTVGWLDEYDNIRLTFKTITLIIQNSEFRELISTTNLEILKERFTNLLEVGKDKFSTEILDEMRATLAAIDQEPATLTAPAPGKDSEIAVLDRKLKQAPLLLAEGKSTEARDLLNEVKEGYVRLLTTYEKSSDTYKELSEKFGRAMQLWVQAAMEVLSKKDVAVWTTDDFTMLDSIINIPELHNSIVENAIGTIFYKLVWHTWDLNPGKLKRLIEKREQGDDEYRRVIFSFQNIASIIKNTQFPTAAKPMVVDIRLLPPSAKGLVARRVSFEQIRERIELHINPPENWSGLELADKELSGVIRSTAKALEDVKTGKLTQAPGEFPHERPTDIGKGVGPAMDTGSSGGTAEKTKGPNLAALKRTAVPLTSEYLTDIFFHTMFNAWNGDVVLEESFQQKGIKPPKGEKGLYRFADKGFKVALHNDGTLYIFGDPQQMGGWASTEPDSEEKERLQILVDELTGHLMSKPGDKIFLVREVRKIVEDLVFLRCSQRETKDILMNLGFSEEDIGYIIYRADGSYGRAVEDTDWKRRVATERIAPQLPAELKEAILTNLATMPDKTPAERAKVILDLELMRSGRMTDPGVERLNGLLLRISQGNLVYPEKEAIAGDLAEILNRVQLAQAPKTSSTPATQSGKESLATSTIQGGRGVGITIMAEVIEEIIGDADDPMKQPAGGGEKSQPTQAPKDFPETPADTPTGIGPAMDTGSSGGGAAIDTAIKYLKESLQMNPPSDYYLTETVKFRIKELTEIALGPNIPPQRLPEVIDLLEKISLKFERDHLYYEKIKGRPYAHSPVAFREEYDRLWNSNRQEDRNKAETMLAREGAAPDAARGASIYKACQSAISEINLGMRNTVRKLPPYTGAGDTAIHTALDDAENMIKDGNHSEAENLLNGLIADLQEAEGSGDIVPLMAAYNQKYPSDIQPDILVADIPASIEQAKTLLYYTQLTTPAEKEAAKQEFTEPTRFDIAQAEQPTSAEKQAARDKLISIANAVDTGVLSSEIKAEKIFTDFGIAKEGKTGLILSIDAVAEGLGAALIGLAKRGVRVILYEDGTKRSQALINIRKELNQQIKDPSNQIAMAFSLEGALNLLSQERIDHITYIGTEEEIKQLPEEVKKRMNVIKTVKEIIEALGQIENMSRMLDDFKSACVRLGLV